MCNSPHCDRISWVSCRTQVYKNPRLDRYALDYCREWSKNCGKPAADAYCQSRGHTSAVSFTVQKNKPSTRVIRGRMVCDDPHCDRMASVTCGPKKRPKPPTVRRDVSASNDANLDDAGDIGVYED